MVTSFLKINLPHNRKKDAIQTVRSILGWTCAQPGCISMAFYQDANNPDIMMLLEEWEDRSSIKNHIRSDYYRSILELMGLSSEQPEIKFCNVSNTKGMEVIERLRRCWLLKPFFIYWATYAQQIHGSKKHQNAPHTVKTTAQASEMAMHNAHMKQLFDTLKVEGNAENTQVVWISDYGPIMPSKRFGEMVFARHRQGGGWHTSANARQENGVVLVNITSGGEG